MLYISSGDGMLFSRIRELREDSDKKQLELANYLNVRPNTYSDYENGKINIPIEQLIKIADFYNVSLDYLVGRNWPKNRRA
jgi:transcriptional regulator with XRE-family HTH domain